jgi:hypothetical protein
MRHSDRIVANVAKKTSTMTFRIDDNVLNTLKDESERREVSLNTFVNQLLKRFVEWGIFEPKVGMIPMAKPIVVELFNKLSKEEVTNMALSIGKSSVHDIALFMKNKMDLNSFLSWFETRMKSSSIELNHSVDNDFHIYTMKHDLGENWSLYHKIVLELMFNEIFEKPIDVTTSNTTVRFKFVE